MGSLFHDLRYALRQLRNSPGFAATLVLVLALGIGVNAAVFSLVDGVLFRPLPGKNPQRLVQISTVAQKGSDRLDAVSFPLYKQYREAMQGFADLAAYRNIPVYFSTQNAEAGQVVGTLVSGNFFQVLGVSAEQGRVILPPDDGARGANPVVVLSDRFWRQHLGAQNVLGSSLQINGRAYTIIGIAPPQLKDLDRLPELWIPLSMAADASQMIGTQVDRETFPGFFVLGRLAGAVSVPQAQAKLGSIDAARGAGQAIRLFEGMSGERPAATAPANQAGDFIDWQRPWGLLKPAQRNIGPDEIHLSWLLLGAASLVLLIACVDVAGLLFARAAQRQKESAIRLALGAARLQLVRQRLVESLVLAAGAAGAGVVLAFWASRFLLASAPSTAPIVAGGAISAINPRAVVFIAVISFSIAIALSLFSTWGESKTSMLEWLKGERNLVRSGMAPGIPVQAVLVSLQIAISFVLLTGAGLLIRTLHNAAHVSLGFATDHVVSGWLDLSRQGYDKARGAAMLGPILDAVSHVPGVESAALTQGNLLDRHSFNPVAHYYNADCSNLDIVLVSPGYFRTLQVPLLRGRDFSQADGKDAPGVVIPNRAAVSKCWHGKDPLEESLSSVTTGAIKTLTEPFSVIGVVGNMRYVADNRPPFPLLYVPIAKFYEAFPWQPNLGIVLRTRVEPHEVMPAVLAAIHKLDGNLVLNNVETPDEMLAVEFSEEHFLSRLLSVFGGLALSLASSGLFGLLSFLTARRTREFGVRLALGAQRSDVLSLVLRQGGKLILGAIVVGVFAAAASARLMRSFLFGVAGTDLLTYGAMAGFILAVGIVACALPAWRATRIEPMTALREE